MGRMFQAEIHVLVAMAVWVVAPDSVAQTASPASPGPVRADIQHVALDLTIDLEASRAFGSAQLDFVAREATARLILDAVDLSIGAVTDEKGTPLAFSMAPRTLDGALEITLARSLSTGESGSVSIQYSTTHVNHSDPANIWGSYGEGLRFQSPSASDTRRRKQAWSSNAPRSARYWRPDNDQPDDLRTFEIKATVPKGFMVISNGELVSSSDDAVGQTWFHWRSDTPHQSHRSAVVIGEFVNVPVRAGGRRLNSYGYPDEGDGVKASIERLPDMAQWMQRTIRSPLPDGGYNQVFVQEMPWNMVGPGLAVLTENFVDSKEVHRDFLYLWDDLEAESLAEQWFGVSAAPESWTDIWLSRGLPRYLATIYNESRNGVGEVQLSQYHVFGDLQTVMADWDAGDRTPIAPAAVEAPAKFVTGNASYIRAGVVLRQLEGEIGRDRLLIAIRKLARSKAGATVTTEDFINAVNSAAKRDMRWFFDQWVTGAGHPVLTPSWTYDAAKREVVLEIQQRPAGDGVRGHNGAGLFRGRLEVEVDGRIESVTMEPLEVNRFAFRRNSPPRFVLVDPAGRWLARINPARGPDELMVVARNSREPLARRTAMIALGAAASSPDADPALRDSARGLMRNVLLGEGHWRLKMTAIAQLRTLAGPAGTNGTLQLDNATRDALVRAIRGTVRDEAWVRFNALNLLGDTRDPAHADLYGSLLRDPSDRIINAAARALGKTGRADAFETLIALEPHPSWKNQSRISMLDGLAELRDPRGVEVALRCLRDVGGARWTLVTPVWDYRLAAVQALKSLKASDQGYDTLLPFLEQALAERHLSDAFYNANLMLALADPRSLSAFDRIEATFRDDPRAVSAITDLRAQLKAALGQ